ncbi:hypothetical protein G6O69_02000 [Pseudenhygromyxa sp. WMMC2535]|uniref:hypothetical protein n=1 Tax=Pseudenhygromyxa sp. WMMC2535 TaxID=2712867 RepID=UPI0015517A17|nr:hypothetical protein [Pseudenhygromyxa sp. WMMC2535]NVB36587.1 hypothetical protein [Pseudenhygromyxa sp. WMMC2535]
MTRASIFIVLLSSGCGFNRTQEGLEPCRYEATPLSAEDLAPWETVLADDFAELVGPYEGTWTWAENDESVTLADAGQVLAARATLSVDLDSVRSVEQVGDRWGCKPMWIEVDGTLSFVEASDSEPLILSIPVTLTRSEDSAQYIALPEIDPIEEHTDKIIPHPEPELDVEGLAGRAIWGQEGEGFYAEFRYGGQVELTDHSSWILDVEVAEFVQ